MNNQPLAYKAITAHVLHSGENNEPLNDAGEQKGEVSKPLSKKRITSVSLNLLSEEFFTVKNDDAMEPDFKEDDLIRVEMGAVARPGDFVLCHLLEFDVKLLRQLKIKRGKLYLQALNPEYKDIKINQSKHKIIGKVIGRTRNVGRFHKVGKEGVGDERTKAH